MTRPVNSSEKNLQVLEKAVEITATELNATLTYISW